MEVIRYWEEVRIEWSEELVFILLGFFIVNFTLILEL